MLKGAQREIPNRILQGANTDCFEIRKNQVKYFLIKKSETNFFKEKEEVKKENKYETDLCDSFFHHTRQRRDIASLNINQSKKEVSFFVNNQSLFFEKGKEEKTKDTIGLKKIRKHSPSKELYNGISTHFSFCTEHDSPHVDVVNQYLKIKIEKYKKKYLDP